MSARCFHLDDVKRTQAFKRPSASILGMCNVRNFIFFHNIHTTTIINRCNEKSGWMDAAERNDLLSGKITLLAVIVAAAAAG